MCAKEKTVKSVLYLQVKNWCFVTYRYFNFSGLPTFTKINMGSCAWKPVVLEASIGVDLYNCEQCNLHDVPGSAACSRFKHANLICDNFKVTFTLVVSDPMLIYFVVFFICLTVIVNSSPN